MQLVSHDFLKLPIRSFSRAVPCPKTGLKRRKFLSDSADIRKILLRIRLLHHMKSTDAKVRVIPVKIPEAIENIHDSGMRAARKKNTFLPLTNDKILFMTKPILAKFPVYLLFKDFVSFGCIPAPLHVRENLNVIVEAGVSIDQIQIR